LHWKKRSRETPPSVGAELRALPCEEENAGGVPKVRSVVHLAGSLAAMAPTADRVASPLSSSEPSQLMEIW
jgi:hypothetical protein